jgi:hypothetical protein
MMSYSPLLAPLLVIGLVRALRGALGAPTQSAFAVPAGRSDERDVFVTSFTWPVLLPLLAAMVLLKDAEQHWTMVAFIPAAIAAGRLVDDAWDRTRSLLVLASAGIALSWVVFLAANVHVNSTVLLRLIPPGSYDPRADIANELTGWDQISEAVKRAASGARGRVVLASNHYSLCGRLLYETHDNPAVYCPTARLSAFGFFNRQAPPADASVVVLTSDIHDELPAGLAGRACGPAEPVHIARDGRPVANYQVRTCAPVLSEVGPHLAQR